MDQGHSAGFNALIGGCHTRRCRAPEPGVQRQVEGVSLGLGFRLWMWWWDWEGLNGNSAMSSGILESCLWQSAPSFQISKSVSPAKRAQETPGYNVLRPKGAQGPLLTPSPKGIFHPLIKNGLNLKQRKFNQISTVYFWNLTKSIRRYSWKNKSPEITKMCVKKEEGSLALPFSMISF